MDVTLDMIKAAGMVPESLYNIASGTGVLYLAESDDVDKVRELALALYDKCSCQREGFALELNVEATDNPLLGSCVVTKRLNLGSLLRYNLLVGKLNCMASVDAFVKEFFNLTSRDDSSFKYIDKSAAHRFNYDPYSDYGQSRFNPHNMMMGMIIARPRVEDPADEEEEFVRSPSYIESDERLIQLLLDKADRDRDEFSLEYLYHVTGNRYIFTDNPNDIKLIFTNDRQFLLKVGDHKVKIGLTKAQAALYLFLLAHPEGVSKKQLSDRTFSYKLQRYYYIMHKTENYDMEKIDSTLSRIADGLSSMKSKINSMFAERILNTTAQSPFMVQLDKDWVHIDLDRKYFEWQFETPFITQE